MFDIAGLNLHFGGRTMFDNASFRVEDGERACIVGPNGAGKSTLLKAIAGLQGIEGGTISFPRNTEIGYLPQHLDFDSDRSLIDECREVYKDLAAHEEEMRELEHRMTEVTDHTSPEFEKIADRYEYLQHELHRRDAYSMDASIGRILSGLGFRVSDFEKACKAFSGGWQMRIALAKLLLQNPDILLLDEPTNHLDIETIEWLGDWISRHEGSVLMVSHERSFMDRLCTKTVALEGGGKVVVYRGNYSATLDIRRERREQQQRAYDNQQQEIAHIQVFIDRFRYQASKAAMVQSRIKMLERMEKVEQPLPDDMAAPSIRFPQPDRTAKEVITATSINKAYGSLQVLKDVDFTLYRGEKVALVGVNGAGKTTLMRMLCGRSKPDSGTIQLGGGVAMEYFAQYDFEDLNPDKTILEEYLSAAPLGASGEARGVLGAFLFSDDEVEKPIRVLSGGERTRLRLAKMLIGKSNTLLLDEPTNHLDIASRTTLERALRQYEGTVLFVSHDRYFLDSVPTRIVEVANGKIRSFQGNYSDYLRMRELADQAATANANQAARAALASEKAAAAKAREEAVEAARNYGAAADAGASGQPGAPYSDLAPKISKEERKKLQQERQEWSRKVTKAEKRCNEAEATVTKLEELIAKIEKDMHAPGNASSALKLLELDEQLKKNRAALKTAMDEWEKAQSTLEELKAAEPAQVN